MTTVYTDIGLTDKTNNFEKGIVKNNNLKMESLKFIVTQRSMNI